mmetsp:Transcript_26881/g.41893  ORF Transcript_26881/g.41893 Transcript_26881/m.41893 type:complete len:109 (-) Transcript_26881:849-1175(-)
MKNIMKEDQKQSTLSVYNLFVIFIKIASLKCKNKNTYVYFSLALLNAAAYSSNPPTISIISAPSKSAIESFVIISVWAREAARRLSSVCDLVLVSGTIPRLSSQAKMY